MSCSWALTKWRSSSSSRLQGTTGLLTPSVAMSAKATTLTLPSVLSKPSNAIEGVKCLEIAHWFCWERNSWDTLTTSEISGNQFPKSESRSRIQSSMPYMDQTTSSPIYRRIILSNCIRCQQNQRAAYMQILIWAITGLICWLPPITRMRISWDLFSATLLWLSTLTWWLESNSNWTPWSNWSMG